MKDMHKDVSLTYLCELFGKSRQGFYQKQRFIYKQAVEDHILLERIRGIRKKMPRIGGRKLQVKLKEQGVEIGRDVLFEILNVNGLLIRRRRNSTRTTMSSHWLRKYPNLIRHYEPLAAKRLWVSDITYVDTSEGFVYLFLITDAYSKKIVGYSIGDNLNAENAVKALQMALKQMPSECKGLIHHSDRGVQYCSNEYVSILNQRGIRISMTENGDPLENAIAERVNGILKDEWIYDVKNIHRKHAYSLIPGFISIYNEERPHMSLNMLTPNEAHGMSGQLKKRWKNYYRTNDLSLGE